jgi:ribosomal protein S6
MSFPLKKAWEATYYLLNIEGNTTEMGKLRRELEINERVLRFLIIKIEAPKAPKARKAPKAK